MVNSFMNYEWFLKEDLSNYAGKWVAIIDKKVVASSKDINQMVKEVKIKFPHKKPLISKIKNKLSIL